MIMGLGGGLGGLERGVGGGMGLPASQNPHHPPISAELASQGAQVVTGLGVMLELLSW